MKKRKERKTLADHLTECWLRMFPDDKGARCTCEDYAP